MIALVAAGVLFLGLGAAIYLPRARRLAELEALRDRGAWFDTMNVTAGLLRKGEPFICEGRSYRTLRNVPEGVFAMRTAAGQPPTYDPPEGITEARFPHTQTVTVIHSWGYHDSAHHA